MHFLNEHSSWVEIDLSAIEENVRIIKTLTGANVMAVVKANAYGHGAVQVANAAIKGGAAWLGVARIEEALELRNAGFKQNIFVLGYIPPAHYKSAVDNQISLAVWDADQIDLLSNLCCSSNTTARLHLNVDTGMSRLGISNKMAVELASYLSEKSGVEFEGIFTHFARADERDQVPTELQEDRFLAVIDDLHKKNIRPQWVHASNSAASINRPLARFNMVRVGISIYGLHPSPDCMLPDGFQPALSWKATLCQVKEIPPGTGVGYGHEYITSKNEKIGTVPVGYADGIRRMKGNRVLVRGRAAPVIGRVCMDQIMIQLDEVPSANVGDEVVIIGCQGGERISAENIAQRWGTINYEVVCGINTRVPRFYQD